MSEQIKKIKEYEGLVPHIIAVKINEIIVRVNEISEKLGDSQIGQAHRKQNRRDI